MRVFLLALVVLALVAIGLAQSTASNPGAVAVNSTAQHATKEEIEQLIGHPISDEEWNKPVGLDPSPAVLLGSTNPSNSASASASDTDSSAAPAVRPLAFFLSF